MRTVEELLSSEVYGYNKQDELLMISELLHLIKYEQPRLVEILRYQPKERENYSAQAWERLCIIATILEVKQENSNKNDWFRSKQLEAEEAWYISEDTVEMLYMLFICEHSAFRKHNIFFRMVDLEVL